MRVFVTGGSGFVGGAVIERLRQDGHAVVALARSEAAARRVAERGAEALHGDLEQLGGPAAPWRRVLADCDAVVHAAAYVAFWGPDRMFERRNLHPTVALHAAAVEAGVRRFVNISAASVSTGSRRAPVVDERTGEGRPNAAYSRVKLATERALRAAPSGQTELVILRPPFVWGAGMTTLDEIADMIDAGRFAWIDGGRHAMDFVHAGNLAHATALALERGTPGHVYYVTDGDPRPVREFISALLATRSVTPPARSVPRPLAGVAAATMEAAYKLARRPAAPPLTHFLVSFLGRDRRYDISAARRDLGYAPVVKLEDGLAQLRAADHRPALR